MNNVEECVSMKKPITRCQYCKGKTTWLIWDIPDTFSCKHCERDLTFDEVDIVGFIIDCTGFHSSRRIGQFPQAIRERSLSIQWHHEHLDRDLMKQICTDGEREPSDQERKIANTIIQWLGTNVGFEFLCNAFKRAGYKIERIDDDDDN